VSNPTPSSPFSDLDTFAALPRMSGLTMSPDGEHLVVAVGTPDAKANRYNSALWQVDPHGVQPAVRLTRGAAGESSAAFTNTGDLLFTSKRPDPEASEPSDELAPLWILPAGLGEARVAASRLGGFSGVLAAAKAPVVVASAQVLAGSPDLAADEKLRKSRKDAGVTAILHDSYPVRFWDHDLGPGTLHLVAGDVGATAAEGRIEFRDLTPAPGGALLPDIRSAAGGGPA